MINKNDLKWGTVSIFCIVLAIFLAKINQDELVPYNLTVVNKLMIPQGKGSTTLAMVFKSEDGHIFDKSVSVTTYAQYNNGDKVVLNLSKNEFKTGLTEKLFLI